MRPCLLFLFLSMALAPLHAQRGATDAQRAAAEGILIYNNGTEPQGIDPHVVTGIPEHKILSSIMEGLVSEHPQSDTEVSPGVAESWTTSEDGRTWTFQLRKNAVWTTGDPVTSADFLYAYRRILNPKFGAKYANMLFSVVGAEDYYTGKLTDFDQVGFSAPDAHTLVVRLRAPVPYLLQLLKHYTWFPIHRPTIEKFDAFERRGSAWTQPGNFVGNGPFQLESWRVNQAVTVVRSPSYWDAANVRLNGIRFLSIENRDTENTAFEAGQLHVTDSVPVPARRRLFERGDTTLRRDRQFASAYLLTNVTRPALDNPVVRRALSLAIDRQTLTDDLLLSGEPSYGFTPPGVNGHEPPDLVEYDEDLARAILAEAGFPGGRGLPKLTMSITTSDTTRTLAEALQAMWRRTLGIEVELRNMEWKVLLDTLDQRNFDLSFLVWYGDYVDPQTFLELMITNSGNNRTNWSSKRYDSLIDSALLEADYKRRLEILLEAETHLLEELPIIPIYWVTHNFRVSPMVRGFGPKLLDQRPWKFVYVTP
jgi:oligopeptide transport system substrate-binding protein